MDPTIIIFLALMIGMMWFVTRRGKKQAANQRQMLEETVVPGASVMTIGGFFGRVVDVDGEVVTLESPSGVETIWVRSAIKEVKEPPFAVVEDDEDADGTSAVVPDDASSLDPGAGTQFRPGGPGVDGSGRLTRDDDGGEPGATPRA